MSVYLGDLDREASRRHLEQRQAMEEKHRSYRETGQPPMTEEAEVVSEKLSQGIVDGAEIIAADELPETFDPDAPTDVYRELDLDGITASERLAELVDNLNVRSGAGFSAQELDELFRIERFMTETDIHHRILDIASQRYEATKQARLRAESKAAKQANVSLGAAAGPPAGQTPIVAKSSYEDLARELDKLRGKHDEQSNKLRAELHAKMSALEKQAGFNWGETE